MDLVELFFRAVGAFYLFAGYVGARAMLLGAVADRMINALADEPPQPGLTGKHAVLGAGVVLTATSGGALMLMSFWALPLFMANLAVQAGWLVLARGAFPPRDEEDERGRRRTTDAAVLYAVVALGVLWLWEDGRLGDADEPFPVGLVLVTAIYFAAWLIRDLSWSPNPRQVFDDPDLPAEPHPRPSRVRLDPCRGAWPLVDVDHGDRFNHLTWLPEELAFRIEDWDDAFQIATDSDEPARQPDFGTAERAAAYVEEGRAIVLALCDHFGAHNVEVSAAFDNRSDAPSDPSPDMA